jgi:hypothetical protein
MSKNTLSSVCQSLYNLTAEKSVYLDQIYCEQVKWLEQSRLDFFCPTDAPHSEAIYALLPDCSVQKSVSFSVLQPTFFFFLLYLSGTTSHLLFFILNLQNLSYGHAGY